MTARDLIAAALRRWYVVLLGAVLTVGALYVVTKQAPVYWTQYNILLVGPSGAQKTTVLDDPVYGLQPLVGVIATDFNDGSPPLLTGDVAATIVGEGYREGVQVRTPNLGTQWRPLFPANYLDVQVAASSPEEVLATARATSLRVSVLLEELQDEMGAPLNLRARAVPSSKYPTVIPVSGSRSRALAATGLSGMAITLAVLLALERRRPSRRPAPAPTPAPARPSLRRRPRSAVPA
ncbi:hypothetical protein Q9S36_48945 [Microbacterium sp. ARD31]|uniref:hypothetical protein n=1 Tax=Microbacterium sp. ARD31 TaxID=2962576 RepID=UPI0028815517|nr:hypothetical protein [Microbacterium sp. ARD31]MDT0188144.1 hypothetical protein [Microbacterium sp. ARD31]